jgi:PleD family two-component response regulator
VAMIEPDEAISNAMRRADMALYKAKNEGRNRVQLSPELDSASYSLALA